MGNLYFFRTALEELKKLPEPTRVDIACALRMTLKGHRPEATRVYPYAPRMGAIDVASDVGLVRTVFHQTDRGDVYVLHVFTLEDQGAALLDEIESYRRSRYVRSATLLGVCPRGTFHVKQWHLETIPPLPLETELSALEATYSLTSDSPPNAPPSSSG